MKQKSFKPKDYQPPYPLDQRIQQGIPSEGEKLDLDFLFVGAGPASLASAIRLAQLFQTTGQTPQIGVIEKAERLGGHTLSGAVINPIAFHKLFPQMRDEPFKKIVQHEKMYFLTQNKKFRLMIPPSMNNKGFYTASLSEVVRWLGEKAAELGVHIFPATSAARLIMKDGQVLGVCTTESGLDKNLQKTSKHQPAISILARTTFLADGVRGHLSQAYLRQQNIPSRYPEHYALGVKEIWQVRNTPKEILHTVGWPLKGFGGSFLYPLSDNHISIGLVSSMDSTSIKWNLNKDFQKMKTHPFFAQILKGGRCLEWGAKAIPEGGFHSIPEKLSGPGVFIIGDAAQLVNVPSLKGVHYAMMSGILAAEYDFAKTHGKTESQTFKYTLLAPTSIQKPFESVLKEHPLIGAELYKVRNIVQILQQSGFLKFLKAGLAVLSSGRFPKDFSKKLLEDSEKARYFSSLSSDTQEASKSSGVYLSGNKTRDDIPPHLTLSPKALPKEVLHFYSHFCPAGVYESKNGKLTVNYPNCIDCKATDILGPWWSPREGGSGPDYNMM